MGKIKILECIRQGQIGGGESHLLSLVEHLDKERFEPSVLSFTDGPMIDRLNKMGVSTTIIPSTRPFDISTWGRVKRLMLERGVQLVHAHGTRAASNAVHPALRLGLPVIYTVHGWSFHPDQHPLVKRLRIAAEQYLVKRTDLNISVAASNQESGRKVLKDFRSVVINNGIDRRKFDPGHTWPNLRSELELPPGALLFLFLARFSFHKQPLLLLEAFKELAQQDERVHLWMVGDGDQKEQALRETSAWSMRDRIHFSPFRQDVPAVLANADVYVLPSLWEGLPIGLLEAMAMRKAVIASDVDGSRELIRDEENGLLVEAGRKDALVAALKRMKADEALRERLGVAAQSTVEKGFDAGRMTEEISSHYCRLAQR